MDVSEIIEKARQLVQPQKLPPNNTWDRHRYEIIRHILKEDPEKFLTWSTVQATMFVGEAPYIMGQLQDIKDSKKERYLEAIIEDDFGNPPRLSYWEQSSGNLVHQMFHLKQLEDITKKRVDQFSTIVEFGGGYGAMCALARRLGFTGEYHIYDLPEFSLLQQYYLSNLGYTATFHADERGFDVPPESVDLLIACFSLSEVPANMRSAFFALCKPKYALIAYQDKYAGLDNKQIFDDFARRYEQYTWTKIPPKYSKITNYLIGKRK